MPPESNSSEIDLRSYIVPLHGKWKTLLKWAAGGAVIMLIFTLVVPPKWKANATILTVLPTESISGGAGASLASALSPNAPDPMQVLEGVLLSRNPITLIMKRTGMKRRDVEKGLVTERKQKEALLTISWEDYDRKLALTVVQGALDGVTQVQHDVSFTSAGLQAKYLEDSVKEQDQKLRDAEQTLADYEKHMKAPINPTDPTSAGTYLKERLDLELQLGTVKAGIKLARNQAQLIPTMPDLPTVIPSAASFRTKLIGLEYQLHVSEITLGPMAPKVVETKQEIEVTRKALNDEIARYLKSVGANLDPSIATLEAQRLTLEYQLAVVNDLANRAPDEAVTLARLAREVVIIGTVSTTLRSKWEEAKVASKVDEVKWAVIEAPYIEDLPTNKRYARNPAIGAVLGFLFCGIFLNWRSRRDTKQADIQGLDGTAT